MRFQRQSAAHYLNYSQNPNVMAKRTYYTEAIQKPITDDYLTGKELCKKLEISYTTLWRYVNSGLMPLETRYTHTGKKKSIYSLQKAMDVFRKPN